MAPLFQFRAWGQQLPHHWSTISNEAAFGTDYFTRTAVAKSNILVNAPNETKYFYQDLDAAGARLNGRNRYTVTFPKGSDAAGQRLLVADALQPASLLRAQRDRALLDRHQEQGPEIRSRRLAHDLRAGRSAAPRISAPTGCRRRRMPGRRTATSRSTSVPTGRSPPSPKAPGRRRAGGERDQRRVSSWFMDRGPPGPHHGWERATPVALMGCVIHEDAQLELRWQAGLEARGPEDHDSLLHLIDTQGFRHMQPASPPEA